jgi:hypothetical protein
MMRSRHLLILAGAALALSACGRYGALKQPAPMFGAQAQAQYEAQQKANAAARAAKQAEKRQAPDDPSTQPLPQAPYGAQIQGRSDPFGTAPPSALGNPGTAPN